MGSQVKLYKVDGRIHAYIPYDSGAGAEEARAVQGARAKFELDAAGRKVFACWTYPLNLQTCRALRAQFGSRIRIHPELAAWAWEARTAEDLQIELRSARDADLQLVPAVAPALTKALADRTYQRIGARFIANGRTVLIADEPGLGKTLETLAGLVEAGAKRVLVFAKKKAAATVWGNEIPRWLGSKAEVYMATGDLTAAKRQQALDLYRLDSEYVGDNPDAPIMFVVCNIEMVRLAKRGAPKFPHLFAEDWDAIVVDESHNALIGKHTQSKHITQTRYGMMRLPLRKGGLKIALSGTPSRGKSENIWGTMNWLRPDLFGSYWRFVKSYFELLDGYKEARVVGEIRDGAGYDKALAPFLLRRTKAEVVPEMPPRQYCGTPLDWNDAETTVGVWLDMTSQQAKHYAEMQALAETRLESGLLMANGILAEMTRLKQFATCCWKIDGYKTVWKIDSETGERVQSQVANMVPGLPSNKYDWILEFAQERVAAGLKIVVASQYTRILNAFSSQLRADGLESYLLTGETRERDVAAIVAAFNSKQDDVPVLFLNTKAGGESITLDACADDVVFIDETYIPDDQEQVENRLHRVSRIHQVNIWYLRSLGTIDEEICRVTGAREGAVKERLDGSRGVRIARKIIAKRSW
jgi:SNF2 family DNA or RNA helicase